MTGRSTRTRPRYLALKEKLLRRISSGSLAAGDRLPDERTLARQFNISRVTVRQTLDLLEKEHLLSRVQGRGTTVRFSKQGYTGPMEWIAVVGGITTPFFLDFLRAFGEAAGSRGALSVYKEDSDGRLVTRGEFVPRLVERGIRNFLIWPHHHSVAGKPLCAARALGCNLVLFEADDPSGSADTLGLDNRDAILTLVRHLHAQGRRRLAYLGWKGLDILSTREREAAFRNVDAGPVCQFPWEAARAREKDLLLEQLRGYKPDAVVCGNGDLALLLDGLTAGKRLKPPQIACVDFFQNMEGRGFSAVAQPLEHFGRFAVEMLADQRRLGGRWKPRRVTVKGRLLTGT